MAKVTSILEMRELENDVVVQAFKAKVSKVYKRTERDGDYGPTSFQDIYVTDGTNEVKMCLKDREAFPEAFKGKEVYFLSYHGDKGWSGVKTKDDKDAQGNPRRMLWVTKTAEIVLAANYKPDGAPAGTAAAPQTGGHAAAPRQPAPQASAPAGAMSTKDALTGAKVFAARRMQLLKVATKATMAFAREFNATKEAQELGLKVDNETFWARVTTLYISLESEGLSIRRGFADAMPKDVDFATLTERGPAPKAGATAKTAAPAPQEPPPPQLSAQGWGAPQDAGHECPRCMAAKLDGLGLCPTCDGDVPF